MLPINAEGGTGKAPLASWWKVWDDATDEPDYLTDDDLEENRDPNEYSDVDENSQTYKKRMRVLLARGGPGCVTKGINLGKYRKCETKPRVKVAGQKRKRVTGVSALRPAKVAKKDKGPARKSASVIHDSSDDARSRHDSPDSDSD